MTLVSKLFNFSPSEEYPMLRTRLGTILHHSSDQNGVYLGAFRDPKAVDHIYCYYPKSNDNQLIQRANNLSECQNFAGTVIIHEPSWVSEYQKFWWSKEQEQTDS